MADLWLPVRPSPASLRRRRRNADTGAMRRSFPSVARLRSREKTRSGARVEADELPEGADLPNIEGRTIVGPSQGFGQLWHKRFTVELDPPVPAAAVVREWKHNFSRFWPGGSELVVEEMAEQQVAGADLEMPAGARVTTGLVVVRAEPQGFTLMTLRGHMFAAWIRFFARDLEGRTAVEIEMRLRAGDPIYEAGLLLGGHRTEERFWVDTLSALAGHFGQRQPVHVHAELLDRRRKWGHVSNMWYNAAIRTQLLRAWGLLRRPFGGSDS